MFCTLFRRLWIAWLYGARAAAMLISYLLAVGFAWNHADHLPLQWFVGLPILFLVVQWFNIRNCTFWDIRPIAEHWKAEDADPTRSRLVSVLGRVQWLVELPFLDQKTIWAHSLPLYLTSVAIDRFCDSFFLPYPLRAALIYPLPPLAQAIVWGYIKYQQPTEQVTTIRGREKTPYEAACEKQQSTVAAAQQSLSWGGLRLAVDNTLTHFTLIGNNRSGKTVNLRVLMQSALAPDDISPPRCRALVLDAKSSFVPILVGMGVAEERIRILNPFDMRCWGWNIAADIRTPTNATNIAAAFIPKNSRSTDEFFQPSARDLLASEMIALHRSCPGAWTLRDLLLVNWTPERVRQLLSRTPLTRHALDRYGGDPRTLANIVATLRKDLAPFEPIASCWHHAGDRQMSLDQWIASDHVLVLGCDDTAKEQLNIINRCIFERVSNLLLAGPRDHSRGRSWIFLDELREFGKTDGLSSLLVRGADFHVNVIMGFQSLQGMWEMFGENVTGEIVGQANNLAVFRLGNDGKTATWAADLIGKAQRLELYQSRTKGKDESVTTSESSHDRHLYMPEELQVLPATCPEHGLQGVFISEKYGVVDAAEAAISGERLFGELLRQPADVASLVPRPDEHHYLQDWDEADLVRLNWRGDEDMLNNLPKL